MATDPDDLDAAIRSADPADPATMAHLGQALGDAELLVPIQPGSGDDTSLLVLEADGREYVPAYTTSHAAMGAVPQDVELRRLPVRELAAVWPEQVALALNAGSEPVGWLEGPGVRQLAEITPGTAAAPERTDLPAGTEIALGEPEEEPAALLEMVADWLHRDGRTERAYRGVLATSGGAPRWVIGLEVAEGRDAESVATELAQAVAEVAPGSPVDVLVIHDHQPEMVGRWLREQTDPFFTTPPRS